MAEQTDRVAKSDTRADSQGSKVLPWVIVGGSGAVAVTGAVLFGLGMNNISEVEDPERGTYYDEIKAAGKRAPVFTGVGAALFGLGVDNLIYNIYSDPSITIKNTVVKNQTLQAEEQTWHNAATETADSGYTGVSYVKTDDVLDSWIEFTVEAAITGDFYHIEIKPDTTGSSLSAVFFAPLSFGWMPSR